MKAIKIISFIAAIAGLAATAVGDYCHTKEMEELIDTKVGEKLIEMAKKEGE